jgi:branched-chain amino acid transport system substrate-binding protein
MNRGRLTALAVVAAAALVVPAVAFAGARENAVSAVPSSSCPSKISYGGPGKPDLLIVSDLPLQSASRPQTVQMGQAINFVLKSRGYKAGKFKVGYQACDDSTAQAATWDSAKCQANARNYARNKGIIGVIGTFNSGCAKLEIPILNRAGVAMISPANTYVGLTQSGPGTEAGEPNAYYPTRKRNYARVVAADNFQGAADATFAQSTLKLKNVYVLNDGQLYGNGLAVNFQNAAKKLGLGIAGFQKWDPKATSYEALGNAIKATNADGVFLSGIVDNQGGKLVKDLRGVLGNNVQILTPDGFTPIQSVVKDAGTAADNVYVSVAGPPIDRLKGAGKSFVASFSKTLKGAPVQVYSAYAAQAATIMLDSIAKSNGTRASVISNVFKAKVTNGIMGTFGIDKNGDTTPGPVTIYQIQGGVQKTFQVITPPLSLVRAV